jgi:hypothetical protein
VVVAITAIAGGSGKYWFAAANLTREFLSRYPDEGIGISEGKSSDRSRTMSIFYLIGVIVVVVVVAGFLGVHI